MMSAESVHPRILSVGSSHPARGWSQRELLEHFEVTDAKVESIFLNSHINNRYLYLPERGPEGKLPEESSLDLWNKHRKCAMELGSAAIERALTPLGLAARDIDYLCCVSSTGFLCPSLTARFIEKLGFRNDVHRFDVVGMGCNAALNALQPIANYCGSQESGIGLEL